MRTEMYVENNRMDISADLSSLITFALDDITDFSSRQTAFSKTIILPGTLSNNRVFGHIFELGQANEYDPLVANFGYNFNASKSANCIIFQANIQTFKGAIRILQINIDQGVVEYECSVAGSMFSLNAKLSGLLLENLDFSAYNHDFTVANITSSWDNPGGSGYYYPLIDYGNYSVAKHDWQYRTFRPALYVKEYIDKMVSTAGFRYVCDLFNTPRFKSLIVPLNQKKLTVLSGELLNISVTGASISNASTFPSLLSWTSVTLSPAFSTVDDANFVYESSGTITVQYNFDFVVEGSTAPGESILYELRKNNNIIYQQTTSASPTDGFSDSISMELAENDYFFWFIYLENDTTSVAIGGHGFIGASPPVQIDITLGSPIAINSVIPKNIRQVDFLVSIVKLFNLYVYEDQFDDALIYFKPYVDFYSTDDTDSIDWTYKLDRNKVRSLTPMSQLNAKKYEFKYKQDSDYYNDLYNKRYGQVYGSYIFDSLYEFESQTKSFELIFAPTPLVGYVGEDKVYPTIAKINNADDPTKRTEEQVDSVIRIMQTKKLTGLTSWDILDDATVLSSQTSYGYAGHFDDPDAPTNDLNFGAVAELFYTLVAGTLSNTQFNIYWSPYMAEITDKDSKLLTADFYLQPRDIFNLDFSKYVYIDGVLFRLNKITDYNMSMPSTCNCSLIKVIKTQY